MNAPVAALASVSVLTLLTGCWSVSRPSQPGDGEGTTTPQRAPVVAESEVGEESRSPFAESPPLQVGPVIRITDVVGISPAAAGVMVAPATESLERCSAPARGKLVVRVVAEGDRRSIDVDSSSLGGELNRCVLEALSTMDFDQVTQPSNSPSDVAPRIESQLTIMW